MEAEWTMKLDKIEKIGSGVKLAHINLFIDVENEESNWCVGTWKLQCTGMAIVVKGNHNINSLDWFLNRIKKSNKLGMSLEREINEFANDLIKADDLMNTTKVA
tara:strand:+ start:179 stop:490 length:312 start_codon:yes stop_codon:yes gene_type:complete